jgi:multidrug resistance efflux pump
MPSGGKIYALDARRAEAPRESRPRRSVRRGGVEARAAARRASHMKALAFVFLALVLVYIVSYCFTVTGRERAPETRVILGNIETDPVYGGVIVRDEIAYVSPADGSVRFSVADEERVKPGGLVAVVEDPDDAAERERALAALDDEIIAAQRGRGNLSPFKKDVETAEARIKSYVESAAHLLPGGFGAVYALKEKVASELSKRNNMMLTDLSGGSGLNESRRTAEENLDKARAEILAYEGGIVCYATDGLEDELTPGAIPNLTKARTSARAEVPVRDASAPVSAGDAVFKVIRQSAWRIVSHIPQSAARELPVGARTVWIKTGADFTAFDASVESVGQADAAGDSLVVFRFDKYMIDFLAARSVELKISVNSEVGLKIPNASIIEKTLLIIPERFVFTVPANQLTDETRAVSKLTGGKRENVPIVPAETREGSVAVAQDYSSLKFGDTLVNPSDASDTLVIADIEKALGVYVTNGGVPVFTPISREGLVNGNADYTVLDPANNRALRENDRVIADVSQYRE